MQKRCCNCFTLYEDLDGMCPQCGHVEGEAGKELYYLSPGTILNSPDGKEYMIGEAVGSGGFGIIYKAWETGLERTVAIKEYFPPKMVTRGVGEQRVAVFSNKKEAEYKKGLYNFLQEATIMSLCADCDNVCNSYNKFEANGTAYMVMEFLNGPILKNYVKEKNRELKEAEILSFIIQTLNGLTEIHKRGVLHLDIAPDNIYVMPDGKIKIADFGAARSKKIKKDLTEVTIKPGFAPPEQYLENAKLGPEADIYAVGANLYWLLTGQVPLESTDREHEDTLEEPAMLALVSPALNNVTMRAMALKPEIRYKSCQEFITALRKEKARSVEEEIKIRKRKRRSFIAALAVTLLAVVAGVSYFGVFKNKIWQDSIVVWVAAENAEQQLQEKARYEEVVDIFQDIYPQVDVEIVVKDAETIEQEFVNASEKERPDLIEATDFQVKTKTQLESAESIILRKTENMVSVLKNQLQETKMIPTGFYVSVIYAESDKALSELEKLSGLTEFIQTKTGCCESDSSEYLTVQKAVPGRYQIMESGVKSIYTAEEFGVYSRSWNKKKAAVALLEYFLTDAAQDILHVQNQSGYMPVAENAWKEFIDVYSEFQYLEDSLDDYSIK